MTEYLIKLILQTFLAFFLGTIAVDIFHYLFHVFLKSKIKFLKKIGQMHLAHHLFFTSKLKIHAELTKKNFTHHSLIEYLIQITTIITCLSFLNWIPVSIAFLLQTTIFLVFLPDRGQDQHHRPLNQLPAIRRFFLVDAAYHAHHHLHPNEYYSSYIKLLDCILGTGHHLAGKSIALTGASGALGSHMKRLLEKERAKVTAFKFGTDYTYDNYDNLKDTLAKTDILVLCHGSKFENAQEANCDSFVKIIELYKSVRKRGLVPLEIWGTGSEIECHPCLGMKRIIVYAKSKRNYARYARQYYRDPNIQYRHLVHSGFVSKMGPGLMSARFAAWMTIFLIKRNFRYVPVTYTGFAFLNYFRFVFNI